MKNLKLVEQGKTYEVITEIRTCKTCGHKKRDKCMLSGYYIETERKYPTKCGTNFDGWIQSPPKIGIFKAIKHFFVGQE